MSNIARIFLDASREHPTRDALVLESGTLTLTLTYRALSERVARLRALLGPVAPGSFVGLFAHRSEAAYAGLLAILSAGAAYVPLNPAFPAARNHYIVQKTGLRTLIVSGECRVAIREWLSQAGGPFRLLSLDRDPALAALAHDFPDRVTWDVAGEETLEGAADISEESPAYVLFTSGSTGNPKGVVVRHRNVRRYVENLLGLYPVCADDRLSQTFDLTFDLSVHDLFVAWSVGAALVVFSPSALASPIPFAREQRITVWFSVPSVAAFLKSQRQLEPDGLPDVRLSFFCGEKLTYNTVQAWRSVASSSRIVNLYGPTETTIAITHFEVPEGFVETQTRGGAIPIGVPFRGQRAEVRREDGTPCPMGEPGGLFLSGDQVAAGYWNEPDLTRSRFVGNGEGLWYRTGDMAVSAEEGVLHFLGREDFQIKMMGYRIELGEIEHALMKASGAAHAVADVAVIRNGVEEIYAVLPSAFLPKKKDLRQALKELLPAYMLPRHYFFTDDFPLNANGKIDRKALRERLLSELPA